MRQILNGAKSEGIEVLLTAGVVRVELGSYFVSVNRLTDGSFENIRDRKFSNLEAAKLAFHAEQVARNVRTEA